MADDSAIPTHVAPPLATEGRLEALYISEPIVITMKDGGIVHVEEIEKKNFAPLVGKICLVETKAGHTFIAEIAKGYSKGKYNLIRGGSMVNDATLISARKIHALNPA